LARRKTIRRRARTVPTPTPVFVSNDVAHISPLGSGLEYPTKLPLDFMDVTILNAQTGHIKRKRATPNRPNVNPACASSNSQTLLLHCGLFISSELPPPSKSS
jgi:hypothetical protein